MAITYTALSYAGGWATGTNSTTIVRANADLADVRVGDTVYNTTRGKYSNIKAISVGATNTTLTMGVAITSQTTTDTISIGVGIMVNGSYDSGTAESGGAETLTDTDKSWTTNANAERIVYITGGTGSGQSRKIVSNTATALTVDHDWDTNPSSDSTYVICYNYVDLVTAVGSQSSYILGAARRVVKVQKSIVVNSGGYYGDSGTGYIFEQDKNFWQSDSGGFLQLGYETSDGYGQNGGNHESYIIQNADFIWYYEFGLLGISRFYNTRFIVVKDPLFNNREFRFNSSFVGFSVPQEMTCKDCEFSQFFPMARNGNIFDRCTFTNFSVLGTNGFLSSFANAKFNTGFIYIYSDSNGNILENYSFSGETNPANNVTAYPIFINYQVSVGIRTYFYSPDFGDNHTFETAFGWWTLTTTFTDTKMYKGQLVNFSVNDSYATPVENVQIGVYDKNRAGAIVSSYDASKDPVKTDVVATDASGLVSTKIYEAIQTGLAPNPSFPIRNGVTVSVNPWSLRIRKYGYIFQDGTRNWQSETEESVVLIDNTFLAASESTAAGYTGITINGSAKTIDVADTTTIQELYDYTQYWASTSTNIVYDEPITTTNGITFTLASGWTMTVTGSLTGVTKNIVGTFTVETGGFYEDSTGAMWELSGNTYYAKHIYRNLKDTATSTNQQYAVVACFDTDNDIDVTYSTALVNGGLTSDASGNVEAYYVYKKDATTYTLTEYIGCYGFDWTTLPVESNGTPVGTSAAYNTIRLATDPNVTLSRVNALAVSGITVTHATSKMDLSDETYSAAQDNLKARQARTDDIEVGKSGYLSYYQEGGLFVFDGSFYTSSTGWIIQNAGFGGTLKDSILELDTAGTYSILLNNCQVNFEGNGTYDLRGATITTQVTVDTINDSTVTAQFTPGTTVNNNDPTNITVESSTAVNITLNNLVAGSRVQIYDTDGSTEIDNAIEATTTYTYSYTYTTDVNIRVRVMYIDGASTAYKWYEITGTITTAGFTANVAQVANSVYTANNIDGSTVTECSINASGIDIDVDDPDNTTTAQRIYAWYQNYLFSEDGIRDSNDYITATDQTHYVFDDTLTIKNLDTVNPLNITGANIVPTTGASTNVFDLSNGASIAINYFRVEGFSYSSGSGLSPEEHNALLAIEVDTSSTIPDQISALNDFDPATDTVARVTLVDTTTTNTDMVDTSDLLTQDDFLALK